MEHIPSQICTPIVYSTTVIHANTSPEIHNALQEYKNHIFIANPQPSELERGSNCYCHPHCDLNKLIFVIHTNSHFTNPNCCTNFLHLWLSSNRQAHRSICTEIWLKRHTACIQAWICGYVSRNWTIPFYRHSLEDSMRSQAWIKLIKSCPLDQLISYRKAPQETR